MPPSRRDVVSALELALRLGTFRLVVTIEPDGHELFFDDGCDRHRVGAFSSRGMPHALRLDEVDLFVRYLTRSGVVPEWALDLLLVPYVPRTADVLDVRATRLRTALAQSGLFEAGEVAAIERSECEAAPAAAAWRLDAVLRGWLFEGQDACSLRRRPREHAPDFPFDEWNRLVAYAAARSTA